jgi:hypothetical protein
MWHKLATLVSKSRVLPPTQKGGKEKRVCKEGADFASASGQKTVLNLHVANHSQNYPCTVVSPASQIAADSWQITVRIFEESGFPGC